MFRTVLAVTAVSVVGATASLGAAAQADDVTAPAVLQAIQAEHDLVVSDNPVNYTPHVLDGSVQAVVQVGDTVVLGGEFTAVANADETRQYERTNLVAFDAGSGEIDTDFAPTTDGEVTSLDVSADGESVYVGGMFDEVNGKFSRGVARLDLNDGGFTEGFKAPELNGRVKDLRLNEGKLWIAGTFEYVSDIRQPALATLDAETGELDDSNEVRFSAPYRNGVLQVLKIDLTPDGSKLMAIGNFGKVDGESRPQVAMLDIDDGAAEVTDWRTDFYAPSCNPVYESYLRDVDIDPSGDYAVISTTGAWRGDNSPCDVVARFELTDRSDHKPTWTNYSGGDTYYAVSITKSAVYAGGHFRWQNNGKTPDGESAGPGALDRQGLAALDPENGLPYRWNPGRTLGVGVFDILPAADGLWVTSDTDRIGDWEYHGRVAKFPLDGGTPVPAGKLGGIPGEVHTTDSDSDSPIRRHYDGSEFGADKTVPAGGVGWGGVRGSFMLDDSLFLAKNDGTFSERSFDGEKYGDADAITTTDELVRDAAWHKELASASGMTYADGRIYYTMPGSDSLYYRYFNLESGAVGSDRSTVSETWGLNLSKASGLFFEPGFLLWGSSDDGKLRRVEFDDGVLNPSTVEVVSGPGIDNKSWKSPATFVFSEVGE